MSIEIAGFRTPYHDSGAPLFLASFGTVGVPTPYLDSMQIEGGPPIIIIPLGLLFFLWGLHLLTWLHGSWGWEMELGTPLASSSSGIVTPPYPLSLPE